MEKGTKTSISLEISGAIERFLEMLASERGCTSHTLEAYQRDLVKWAGFVQDLPFNALTPSHRQEYIQYLKNQNLSSRSIARHLSALRQFVRFLLTEGTLDKDPWEGMRSPRYVPPLPRVLSLDQIQHVFALASQDKSVEGIRLLALIEMLYATGMRISELVTLPLASLPKTEDLSFLIRGKGGHERFVFLTSQAITALKEYLLIRSHFLPASFNPYLFPSRSRRGHLTRQRVGQLLKELALQCGLFPSHLSPHALRHAFATHLLYQGVDLITLKQLLGHQDISTTQIYTHVEAERWAELLNKYHPLAL